MKFEKSCGAVLFTEVQEERKYVLVQSIKGEYGFPKGHMEENETEIETALREIYEECHIRPQILKGFRKEIEYALPDKENVSKKVVYFLAHYAEQEIQIQEEEIAESVFATYEEAMNLLPFEDLRAVLQAGHAWLERNSDSAE